MTPGFSIPLGSSAFLIARIAALFDADQMISNVGRFVEVARQWESRGSHSLRGFVDYLRELVVNFERYSQAPTEEEESDSVKLMTIHAAKGLEWDRVYLLAVSSYDFPSGMPSDRYIAERWFTRFSADGSMVRLNLEAELLAQLDYLVGALPAYEEGSATLEARVERARERLRLLYVGVTRAKRELIVSWNMGHYANKGAAYENPPALPLIHLGTYNDYGYE